eukprot:g31650.t1
MEVQCNQPPEQEVVSCWRSVAVPLSGPSSDLGPLGNKQQATEPNHGHLVMEKSSGHMLLPEPSQQVPSSQEQEVLIELQPIPFHQNPFVVANRKGREKARDLPAAGASPQGTRGNTSCSVQASTHLRMA